MSTSKNSRASTLTFTELDYFAEEEPQHLEEFHDSNKEDDVFVEDIQCSEHQSEASDHPYQYSTAASLPKQSRERFVNDLNTDINSSSSVSRLYSCYTQRDQHHQYHQHHQHHQRHAFTQFEPMMTAQEAIPNYYTAANTSNEIKQPFGYPQNKEMQHPAQEESNVVYENEPSRYDIHIFSIPFPNKQRDVYSGYHLD